ncbi:MAG: hypothetical protein IPJ19_18455 [Planctomycetes bacterium]|nr:hypothetical protein [Planctomycetota bacterium]
MSRTSRRAGIVLLSLAIALLAANAALARWYPLPARMYGTDPELVYRPIPNARSVKSVTEQGATRWVTTQIDAQGFRAASAPGSGPCIAVYGDSFVFAEDVRTQDTFVEQLGLQFGSSGSIQTVNAGVVGYGPDQSCLRLEQEFERVHPDLVVLVLCSANDFGDLVRNKLFDLDGAGKLVRHAVEFAPELLQEFEAKARAADAPALLRAWRSWRSEREERARIAVAGGVQPPWIEWYLAQGQDEYKEYVVEHQLAVRQVWQDYYDADLALHPEWESARYKQRLMRAVLERMRDDCARRKLPFAVLIAPSAVDLCPQNEIHVDPRQYPSWDPARLTRTLAQILDELGVPSLDLYEPFRAAGAEQLFIGGGNMHWNAAGQELAAQLFAQFLRERGVFGSR